MECPICFETFDDQLERCPYCKTKIETSKKAEKESKKIVKGDDWFFRLSIFLTILLIAGVIAAGFLLTGFFTLYWWIIVVVAIAIFIILHHINWH